MPNERVTALYYLSKLSDKAFAEFFYEAVRDRNTSDIKQWKGHFVLADAEQVEGEPWEVVLIASQDSRDNAKWANDVPICQSGQCRSCTNLVRSWTKTAICPVCGQHVYLT